MDDDFGITACAKDVPKRLQLGDQVNEVVDFTIEYHRNAAIFVEQWLMSGGEVDDGQASVTQTYAWFDMQTAFIWPAMK